MSFYEIPLKQRFTRISQRGPRLFSKNIFKEIDGIGLRIECDNEDELTVENIRRHGTLVGDSSCIVEAENIQEAIRKFYKNWDGADIGGKEETAKALWIDRPKPIIGLPYCHFLRISDTDRFICGEQVQGECYGERGMCVLEPDIDPPPSGNCPINELNLKSRLSQKKLVIEKVVIDEREYLFIDTNKK
ncbi:MAG: hypothetical protein WC998_04250 [Candidatus Paceibacterota bacterium]|jgi:hypothetical protein